MKEPEKLSKNISGILPVNKPAGISSSRVVSGIKKSLGLRKAGHSGTLDPMASGVLVVLVGGATKIMPYLREWDKEYSACALIGVVTSTDDMEGDILERKDPKEVKRERVKEVLRGFEGFIDQVPPVFSAKKHKGRAHYKYAREGILVERNPVRVKIDSISLKNFSNPEIEMKVVCHSGTYIRSICRDMGEALGVGACMKSLERTRNGPFSIENSYGYEDLVDEGMNAKEKILRVDQGYLPFKGFKANLDLEQITLNGGLIKKKDINSEIKGVTKDELVSLSDIDGNTMGVFRCLISSSDIVYIDDGRDVFQAKRLFN